MLVDHLQVIMARDRCRSLACHKRNIWARIGYFPGLGGTRFVSISLISVWVCYPASVNVIAFFIFGSRIYECLFQGDSCVIVGKNILIPDKGSKLIHVNKNNQINFSMLLKIKIPPCTYWETSGHHQVYLGPSISLQCLEKILRCASSYQALWVHCIHLFQVWCCLPECGKSEVVYNQPFSSEQEV